MSGGRRLRREDASASPAGGGDSRSLNLIHTNISPNPASMRVPGRFRVLPIKLARAVLWLPVNHLHRIPGGPVRWLWLARLVVTIDTPLRRALHGRPLYARSTR